MRSLGSIRARIERLASVSLPPAEETLILHWKQPVERCLSCDADLEAHAEAALPEAVARHAPGEPPPTVVFYSTDELTTRPR